MKLKFKKSLLIASLATAFAGAHAEGISFYALLDGGVASTQLTGSKTSAKNGSTSEFVTGGYAPNFLGLTGSKKEGGITAGFYLEQGFNLNPTQNASSSATSSFGPGSGFYNRQANLYVEGSFGKVAIGTTVNPVFKALLAVDPRGTGYGSSIQPFIWFGGNTYEQGALEYISPTMNGVTADVQYVFANENPGETLGANAGTATKDGERLSLSYTAGDLTAAMGIINNNTAVGATVSTGANLFGLSYKMGDTTLKGIYLDSKVAPTTSTNVKVLTTGLGGTYALSGKTVLDFGYYTSKDHDSSSPYMNVLSTAVGFQYELIKDIKIYGQLVNVNNKTVSGTGTYMLFSGAATVAGQGSLAAGEKATVVNAGLVYSFF